MNVKNYVNAEKQILITEYDENSMDNILTYETYTEYDKFINSIIIEYAKKSHIPNYFLLTFTEYIQIDFNKYDIIKNSYTTNKDYNSIYYFNNDKVIKVPFELLSDIIILEITNIIKEIKDYNKFYKFIKKTIDKVNHICYNNIK